MLTTSPDTGADNGWLVVGEHQVPRLPRKSHRQGCGDTATPGRTSNPLQSTKSRACHANHTGRAAATQRPQGVHPTPCRAPSPAPATQKPPVERRRPRDTRVYNPCRSTKSRTCHAKATTERRRPRDARAYIRPFAEHQVPRLPRKSHRQSGGDQGTPGRTSNPLQEHQVPRLLRKSHRQRPRDARAYIRPLAEHQVGGGLVVGGWTKSKEEEEYRADIALKPKPHTSMWGTSALLLETNAPLLVTSALLRTRTSNKCIATSNKCIASSHKCIATRNVTSALLLVTSASLHRCW